MKATLEKVKEIFRAEFDQRIDVMNFNPDVSYLDQGVDSLDRSSVFLAIEEAFGVHVPDKEIASLDTYNKIVDFINTNE
jgi:acyl carrier protein